MDKLYYFIYNTFLKPLLKIYLRSDSKLRYDGFKLIVLKGVFHPKLFFSTGYFYEFLKKQDLQNKRFLEIGCGSGILSLLAARKGAKVTAIDIDANAIKNTTLNVKNNLVHPEEIKIIQSDVFSNLQPQPFDVIVINPPYYFKPVQTASQYAWYCGEDGEYFQKLFRDLHSFITKDSGVFMILEEKCEIERIQDMAAKFQIKFHLLEQKKIKFETSFIFGITLN